MRKFSNQGDKDTRSGFGEGLTELGRNNSEVVALCADLTGSLKMNTFADENPERFFQVGIAEANMIGLAAGLATGGKIPFTGTFANFSTGRVYDQIRQSVAYSNKNVKIHNWERERIIEHEQMRHTKFMDRIPTSVKKLRVVEIVDVDLCPCGGTHVDNTSKLSEMNITNVKSKGAGKLRISYSLNNH